MAESKDALNSFLQDGGMNGWRGCQIINDTSTHYGEYAGFKTLTSSVQLSIYTGLTDTASTISAFVFDNNIDFQCYTTSIALSTGTVMMFYIST